MPNGSLTRSRIHDQEALADQTAREKATAAQQSTLNKIGPQAQEQTQSTEQQRLNALYNNAGSAAPGGAGGASPLLSGEGTGNQSTTNSIMSQINQATAQARSTSLVGDGECLRGFVRGLGTTVLSRSRKGATGSTSRRHPPGNLKPMASSSKCSRSTARSGQAHQRPRQRQSPPKHRRHAGGLGWAENDRRCELVTSASAGGVRTISVH